jgi:hypothetical protein
MSHVFLDTTFYSSFWGKERGCSPIPAPELHWYRSSDSSYVYVLKVENRKWGGTRNVKAAYVRPGYVIG